MGKKPLEIESKTFSIKYYDKDENPCSCDWNWMKPGWGASHREYETRVFDGELTEEGRQILLEEYGLSEVADELPLALISTMSPDILMEYRRMLEKVRGLPRHPEVTNGQLGHYVRESVAA